MDKHSPTPWHVEIVNRTFHVEAADGGFVALFVSEADAALIVEAVNGVEATRKLQRTLLGWSMERDRLRDLVRRLCDELESHYHEPALMDDPCIVREAREALEDEQ